MENERLKKQLEFCREIDKEKFIGRQTYKSDAQTKENDAEHLRSSMKLRFDFLMKPVRLPIFTKCFSATKQVSLSSTR